MIDNATELDSSHWTRHPNTFDLRFTSDFLDWATENIPLAPDHTAAYVIWEYPIVKLMNFGPKRGPPLMQIGYDWRVMVTFRNNEHLLLYKLSF